MDAPLSGNCERFSGRGSHNLTKAGILAYEACRACLGRSRSVLVMLFVGLAVDGVRLLLLGAGVADDPEGVVLVAV